MGRDAKFDSGDSVFSVAFLPRGDPVNVRQRAPEAITSPIPHQNHLKELLPLGEVKKKGTK